MDGENWLSLLVLITFFRVNMAVELMACTETQFDIYGNGSRCCTKCSPGFGLAKNCSIGNDTVCQQCVLGETYSSGSYHVERCKPCSKCVNAHLEQPCNLTHDTVCRCYLGYYFSQKDKMCKQCDPCGKGMGVKKVCNPLENTVCSNCTNGTYSDKLSAFAKCQACSKCVLPRRQLQECSADRDSICFAPPTPPTSKANHVTYHDEQITQADIIPLYCALLGAVVVGLLGYVAFKHYRRLQAKRRHKGHDPHEEVEYSKASGGDSGVFVEADSQYKNYTYSPMCKIRDLPHGKRKDLEKVMVSADPNSWKFLARELGYDKRRIIEFESKALREHTSGFKPMFFDWARQTTSTVGVLVKALKHIGRHDAVRVLYVEPVHIERTPMIPESSNIV